MTKPYDFVPFLKFEPYNSNEQKFKYEEGRIPIRIKTLTPIHISSGEYGVDNSNSLIYKEFIKINNIPVIPGTSFKGCIRSIAESISHSCISLIDKRKYKSIPEFKFREQVYDKKNEPKNINERERKKKDDNVDCIVCDMFGSLGHKSKITFSDLKGIYSKSRGAEYRFEIKGMPVSFNPHPETDYYFENGKYKGYKFYKHGRNGIQPKGEILCEFVSENSFFEGEIIFRNLTEEQIQLLCFSMGLSGDINPKIGYGKNYYYGSIEVTSDEEWIEKARQYKINADNDIKGNIERLISILSYKNAVSSLDYDNDL